MRLSSKVIREAKHPGGDSDVTLWDEEIPTLGLRVYPSGKKSFVMMYRFKRRLRRCTLGQFPKITLQEARKLALKNLGLLANGVDPGSQRNDGRRSMNDLLNEYIEWATKEKKSWKGDEYRINQWIRPCLGRYAVESVESHDIDKLHRSISKNAPIQANRVLSLLHALFNKARKWGYLPKDQINPAAFTDKNKEGKRKVWVKPGESMEKLLEAIEAEKGIFHRSGLLLYLLTGLRNRELMRIRRDRLEIRETTNRLTGEKTRIGFLLVEDTKSGRDFHCIVPEKGVEILESLPQIDDSPWFFPAPDPSKHLAQFPRSCWDRVRERAGMPELRIHDLRRTYASWLASQGVPLKFIAGLLNQTSKSITDEVYAHLADDPLLPEVNAHANNLLSFEWIRGKKAV